MVTNQSVFAVIRKNSNFCTIQVIIPERSEGLLQCFFFPKFWKNFQNFSVLEILEMYVLEKISEHFPKLQTNREKMKRNSYCKRKIPKNFACGALKYRFIKGNCLQNANFQRKIAPEGREKNWDRKFPRFRKTNKKTLTRGQANIMMRISTSRYHTGFHTVTPI